MLYPVILAGGKGERFWPYSNSQTPKQLLPLVSEKSLLEDTLERVSRLKTGGPVYIITSRDLEKPISRFMKGNKNVILVGEPAGRDTAPAIALACRLIMEKDPRGVMAVMTADHFISPSGGWVKAVKAAARMAALGKTLVTFGIRPERADTGYGYIETGNSLGSISGLPCFRVRRFHEKPGRGAATKYFNSKRFFWNSGMFAWDVSYLWKLYRQFLPGIAQAFESAGDLNPRKKSFSEKLKRIYGSIEKISIDFGIMEKAPDISVLVPDFRWDDIGSWAALERHSKKDASGNIKRGQAFTLDTSTSICFSTSGMVAAFGVKDLIIVHHAGVTMVVHQSRLADLKQLVQKVGADKAMRGFI